LLITCIRSSVSLGKLRTEDEEEGVLSRAALWKLLIFFSLLFAATILVDDDCVAKVVERFNGSRFIMDEVVRLLQRRDNRDNTGARR